LISSRQMALRHDLVGVTHETFQPAHVSMWLAPADDPELPRHRA